MSVNSSTDVSRLASGAALPRVVFRMPGVMRWFAAVATLVLGVVSAMMTGFAIMLLFGPFWAVGLFAMAPCAILLAALTGYCARDLRGKWGIRVVLEANSMILDLPSGRSLIHRPPSQHLEIRYAEVESIETRLEAFGSLGMEMIQRAYVLRPKKGELIFLFEDRALNTALEVAFFPRLIAQMVARVGMSIRDIGMVEGKGGVLAVWGTEAPDWGAPPLSAAQQLRLWRHAGTTGSLAVAVVIIALVIRLISGPL